MGLFLLCCNRQRQRQQQQQSLALHYMQPSRRSDGLAGAGTQCPCNKGESRHVCVVPCPQQACPFNMHTCLLAKQVRHQQVITCSIATTSQYSCCASPLYCRWLPQSRHSPDCLDQAQAWIGGKQGGQCHGSNSSTAQGQQGGSQKRCFAAVHGWDRLVVHCGVLFRV